MDQQISEGQKRMRGLLDDHFLPMLRDEWKNSMSIYEVGCRPKDGKFAEVIVWIRSTDLVPHITGLMAPSDPMMVLDSTERTVPGKDEDSDSCRQKEDTVMVRLLKEVTSDTEGQVQLMVELFQVFENNADAREAYERAKKVTHRDTAGN